MDNKKWLLQFNLWIERNYGYVALVVVGAIILLMTTWFLWPQYQRMQSAGILQYYNMTQVLEQRRQYVTDLEAMASNYQQLDQRVIRAIDVALPEHYSDGPVYAEVEQLVEGTKYTVQSVNVSAATTDTTEPAAYDIVTLSLNLSAVDASVTYQDFKDLLDHIERYPHLMNLESLTYNTSNSGYSLVLKTYQRKADL